MNNSKLINVLAVAVFASSGVVHAGFAIEGGASAPKKSAYTPEASTSKSAAGLTQVGVPAGPQPVVRGMAKDIALITALKQVVPTGWKAKRAGELDVNQLVGWRADGRTWVELLQELAVSNKFSVLVDWDRHEVTVAPATFLPTGDGLRPSSVVSAPAGPVEPKAWVINTTMTLRENVEAWAKEAGWTVSWAAVDYPVSTKFTLTGLFEDEEAGPLRQLAKAYESARQPLTFTYYTNKVVRVENASFQQINVRDQLPNHRALP